MSEKKKRNAYWIVTILLALGMLSGGSGHIFHTKRNVDLIVHLGYPLYFLYILGIWKILGVIAILISKVQPVKRMGLCRFLFCYVGSDIFTYRIGRWYL